MLCISISVRVIFRILWCLRMTLRQQNYLWGFPTLRLIKSWWSLIWWMAKYVYASVSVISEECSRCRYRHRKAGASLARWQLLDWERSKQVGDFCGLSLWFEFHSVFWHLIGRADSHPATDVDKSHETRDSKFFLILRNGVFEFWEFENPSVLSTFEPRCCNRLRIETIVWSLDQRAGLDHTRSTDSSTGDNWQSAVGRCSCNARLCVSIVWWHYS